MPFVSRAGGRSIAGALIFMASMLAPATAHATTCEQELADTRRSFNVSSEFVTMIGGMAKQCAATAADLRERIGDLERQVMKLENEKRALEQKVAPMQEPPK